MALIVENGSIVEGANSYATLAQIRAYAADRGVTLSDDDTVLTPYAILATDYLESKSDLFVGKQVQTNQPLSWPRQGVIQTDNSYFPTNQIPPALVNAQCQLVIEQVQNGVTLLPTIDRFHTGGFVTHEKLGPMETTFSERVGTTVEPIMPAVDSLLKSLMFIGGPWTLSSKRI